MHHTLRPQVYPPAKQARRLTEVLQALDGALAGATRREIAVAMFGRQRVGDDWRSRSLREKVRNAIKSGRVLMGGGYRRLLR